MLTLESDRLIMRDYKASDIARYHKMMSDRVNLYYLIELTTDSMAASQKSMQEAINLNAKGETRRFCLALKGDDRLIGAVGYEVAAQTPAGKIADPMGWFMLPEYQGQGYMTEAVERVLAFAFLQDNCVRVATGCFKENLPTQRVMAKAGFRKEAEKPAAMWLDGRMRDRLEFAINREEYRRAQRTR